MYSPKVNEKFIKTLYYLGQSKKKPMTYLVNEAISQYLEREAGNIVNEVAQKKKRKR